MGRAKALLDVMALAVVAMQWLFQPLAVMALALAVVALPRLCPEQALAVVALAAMSHASKTFHPLESM